VGLIAALLLGFLLPGWSLGRLLRSPAPWTTALVLSLPLLFAASLGLQVLGFALRGGSVAILLGVFTVVAWWFSRKEPAPPSASRPAALFLLPVAVLGALLLLRTTLQPLAFVDNLWRWDHLAVLVGERASLDFYPPASPGDYALYPYADGIPPMVSLAYWFLYQGAGGHQPSVTSLFVVLQYLSLVALTWRLGSRLFGPWAGGFGAACLVSSRLLFRAVATGHETGLTTLSLVGSLYFLVVARDAPRSWKPVLLAALAASVAPNSREYALAFLPLGALAAWGLALPKRCITGFLVVSTALAAPWYLRNWLRTGNPLFDNPIGGFFPGNPVHLALLHTYAHTWRQQAAEGGLVARYALELLAVAPLQLAGLGAGLLNLRRTWYLLVPALAMGAIWWRSTPFTAGGGEWAMRVMAPALPLLSLSLAAGIEVLARRAPFVRRLAGAGLVASFVWTVPFAMTWATPPEFVPARFWGSAALHDSSPVPQGLGRLADLVEAKVEAGGRLVSNSQELTPLLLPRGRTLVPVWSPEVTILFDPALTEEQARKELRRCGIGYAVLPLPGRSMDVLLLHNFPFFAEGPDRWTRLGEVDGMVLYRLPEDP